MLSVVSLSSPFAFAKTVSSNDSISLLFLLISASSAVLLASKSL
nr:hypothetical protein [Mycoplasmopsis agalactiae]